MKKQIKKDSKNIEIKEIKKDLDLKEIKPSIENIDDLGRIRKRKTKFRDEEGDKELAEFLETKKPKDFFIEDKEEISPKKRLESNFVFVKNESEVKEEDSKQDPFNYNVNFSKEDKKYAPSENFEKIESFVSPKRIEISESQKNFNDLRVHKSLMSQSSYPEINSGENEMYKKINLSRPEDLFKNKKEISQEVKYTPSEY